MMPRALGAALMSATLWVGCEPVPPGDPGVVLVQEALPSVVLLINERDDGSTSWGSGLLVGDEGLVLTNLHVVDHAQALRAMLYQPERTSYTPMDGGLTRYLFENERDLVPARLVRRDEALDLAVARVLADTTHLARLPVSEQPLHPGQRVLALGHPQETVWSFTSGVVSALHSGAIQHDASVNAGSSGGPLVDGTGQVVGINTSKVLGESEGVAFARPIGLALRVVDEAAETLEVDLSSPDRAALSCIRSQELASASTVGCYDWDYRWSLYQDVVRGLDQEGIFPPGAVAAAVAEAGGRDYWVGRMQDELRAYFTLDADHEPTNPELYHPPPQAALERAGFDGPGVLAALDEARADRERGKAVLVRRWAEDNHVQIALSAASAQQMIKAGVRVEQVHHLDGQRAWVHLVGRNPDDSQFCWSELYRLNGSEWRQLEPVREADRHTLPEGWPSPFDDVAVQAASYRVFLLSWVGWSRATETERQAALHPPCALGSGGEPVVEVEILSGEPDRSEPTSGMGM